MFDAAYVGLCAVPVIAKLHQEAAAALNEFDNFNQRM